MTGHRPIAVTQVDSVPAPRRARVSDLVDPMAPMTPDLAARLADPLADPHDPATPRLTDAPGLAADTAPAPVPASPPVSHGSAAPRQRDYLAGFLAEKPAEPTPGAVGEPLYDAVIAALKDIYDPEIPVNIYDLGLIYDVTITDGHARVLMTLTTPHCPVAESMPAEVELRVGAVAGIGDAEVVLVWDPPWDPAKMSDEARLELGML